MRALEPTAGVRTAACAALGAAAGAAVASRGPWELAVTAGWSAFAATQVAWVWAGIGRADPAGTRRYAHAGDDSRATVRAVVLAACVVSILAMVAGLHRAARVDGFEAAALRTCALASIALSWALIHSLFTLHYADIYYSQRPPGGIDFPDEKEPDFRDFAYVAFGVGTTYQVADTDLTGRAIRRTVLWHALLSYLFGVAIIGATINVLAGLV